MSNLEASARENAKPRVEPVVEPDEDQRTRLAKAPTTADGAPLGLFATLAHRPRLMTRINALGGALMFDSSLAERERELVILRTAGHARCTYQVVHHRSLGATAGLTAAEIDAAIDPAVAHTWKPADGALLRVVDEVTVGADVSDLAWSDLDGVLDAPQRIELLALVGFYRMLAGVLNGARVIPDADPFTPERRATTRR
jgi:AhpD family alkylhydroperoxidase